MDDRTRKLEIQNMQNFIKGLTKDAKDLDKTVKAWQAQFKQAKKRGDPREVKDVGQTLLQFQSSRNQAWKDVAVAKAQLDKLKGK